MKLSNEQLLKILKAEEADAASYHQSELAKNQEDAIKRFYGEAYGDEMANRSKVVVKDLQNTILWMMPELMRTFRPSSELVSVEATSAEDDAPGEHGKSRVDYQASYLSHVFFKDNPGLINVHDFAFDGLLERTGVMRVAWADPEAKPPKIIENVSGETIGKYVNDPAYEILSQEETEPNSGVFTLEVKHTPKIGRGVVESFPSNEFAISRTASTIEDAGYHRRKRKVFVADLCRQFPDSKQALRERKKIAGDDDSSITDGRAQARSKDQSAHDDSFGEEGRERCTLLEEYLRVDMDGDDIVELRCIKRVGDVILENEVVEESEFVSWTPHRIAHKFDGLSLHDIMGDLQKIRTIITRNYLDGLGQSLNPRTYVDVKAVSEEHGTLEAIEANDVGAVVPVNGNPREMIWEATTPDISAPALQALEHFDQRVQESSGVTRQSQGMDPQAMNKTATGIDLLQAAAKTRIELVATWLGMGVEEALGKLNRLLIAHQDGARQIKLFGQWTEIDPRTWSDEAAVSVHIGSAGVSRQQRLTNYGLIAQKQEQVLMTAGPQNPLVSLQHLRATYAGMVSEMGFKDTATFFGEIPQDWQPPEPGPDPKVAAEQGKLQLEQAKAQQTAQADQAKMQHSQALSEAEFQHKTRLAELDAQTQREIAMLKIQSERELARMRIASEQQLARERMEIEMQMAQQRADREHELAVKKHDANSELNGFRPGGSLAQ